MTKQSEFSPEIVAEINYQRYNHLAPLVQRRMGAIRLKAIELCFLPFYSPNLNLIERVWKLVKKKCLCSKYYETFPTSKTAISKCLDETRTTHKSELDSLLTLRFQLFQKAQFVTA